MQKGLARKLFDSDPETLQSMAKKLYLYIHCDIHLLH